MKKLIILVLCIVSIMVILLALDEYNIFGIGVGDFILLVVGWSSILRWLRESIYQKGY